jgi:hypothetical protein
MQQQQQQQQQQQERELKTKATAANFATAGLLLLCSVAAAVPFVCCRGLVSAVIACFFKWL